MNDRQKRNVWAVFFALVCVMQLVLLASNKKENKLQGNYRWAVLAVLLLGIVGLLMVKRGPLDIVWICLAVAVIIYIAVDSKVKPEHAKTVKRVGNGLQLALVVLSAWLAGTYYLNN